MRVSGKWLRFIGILLLIVLLWRLDTRKLISVLKTVDPFLLISAILINLPQISVKAFRWRRLLQSHRISYSLPSALLSYFGSIFIGLLTPGRLGELVKALHVSRDCQVPTARAFSSVLVDRLFDLYALLLFGGAALLSQMHSTGNILILIESTLILTLPLVVVLHDGTFNRFKAIITRTGKLGQYLFSSKSWLMELRVFLKDLSILSLFEAVLLTLLAYSLFFSQCYLLAMSMRLPLSFLQVAYASALGSLVTLIPISISGLGTREATIVAYLGTLGVKPEAALGYSFLVFITFYISTGLMGAIAWLAKPVRLQAVESMRQEIQRPQQ